MSATLLAREHLHGFLRSLREAGIAAPAQKQADFLLAVTASPPEDVDALYWRARVTLLTAVAELEVFEALFDAWFREGRLLVETATEAAADAEGETPAPRGRDDGELETLEPGDAGGLRASPAEALGTRRFGPASAEDRAELAAIADALATALPACTARRSRRARRGAVLDLDRTLRGARRSGGEVMRLEWRRRPPAQRRVLLLIDVSGSQRAHSAALLRFAHAVVRTAPRAEAFTFGTRLTRVTAALAAPDVDAALAALADVVHDADGGTRIGPALEELLGDGRFVAHARGALVIVLSDGLERGDPAAMAGATRRLARLAHRLVWWSPLACDPAYRPLTRGMAAVLGELDALAGARDLPTLLAAVRALPAVSAGPRGAAWQDWER